MKKSTLLIAASLLATSTQAGNLYLAGDAMSYGWNLDDATCIVSGATTPDVYQGTLWLEGGKDFKFLTTPDFGNEEIGAAEGATLTDGKIALAKGKEDTGYGKIQVAESANYLITVDVNSMEATIVKAEYQETHISYGALFLVGDATPGGWSLTEGTPLRQNVNAPYIYEGSKLPLKSGNFKIATAVKNFDQKHFYFRDAADANKMVPDQDGDIQWNIASDGEYDIVANTISNAISIKPYDPSGIGAVDAVEVAGGEAEWYTLQGVRVSAPESGVYVKVVNGKAIKVAL